MVAQAVLDSLFMSEWITFMIYVVKILLVCCATYVKLSAKLLFFFAIRHKPIRRLKICHNIIICVANKISL